ncbi:uncharacterized protein LOC121754660 [Salvia splendens]|uniref:uncharacterized protein LOC121754660 n=1 Tax=Salvia splendens TaxID=180675 RepID=UPI001C26FA1E|nr:uncharacterized protein LOC121754660 [Salvia splendens]
MPVELELIHVDVQTIHTKIRCLVSDNSFNFTLVYGNHTISDRRPLWDSLIEFVPQDEPALVSGDFNNVMAEDEIVGGNAPTEYEVKNMVDTCALLGLEDVMSTGCRFKRSEGGILSKIDRAMVNEAWYASGYMAATEYLPPGAYTDHSPVITTLFGNISSYPKPFKFFNFWLKHDKFNELMEQKWPASVVGMAQYKLAERCRLFKSHLRAFNFQEFSDLSNRAKVAAEILEELQKRTDWDISNVEQREQIQDQRKISAYLADSERAYFEQKAKLKYSLLSDRGTSFFHSLVNRNNTRNYIACLHRNDGSIIKDQAEIIRDFVEYFTNL